MKKIPTLYLRDPENRAHVLPTVNPGCEWVLAGEGEATRKYDGTCVQITHGWYDGPLVCVRTRREVKPGMEPPPGCPQLHPSRHSVGTSSSSPTPAAVRPVT